MCGNELNGSEVSAEDGLKRRLRKPAQLWGEKAWKKYMSEKPVFVFEPPCNRLDQQDWPIHRKARDFYIHSRIGVDDFIADLQ